MGKVYTDRYGNQFTYVNGVKTTIGGNQGNRRTNNAKPQYKKSGFDMKMIRDGGEYDGMVICWGWRKTKMGIQRLYARPYRKTKFSKSENGNDFLNLFVTLQSDAGIIKTSGLFNMTTKKLIIQDMGLIGSLNGRGQTASGKLSTGFFGKLRKG